MFTGKVMVLLTRINEIYFRAEDQAWKSEGITSEHVQNCLISLINHNCIYMYQIRENILQVGGE